MTTLQIKYTISQDSFLGFLELLKEMKESSTMSGDEHAETYANKLRQAYLVAPKSTGMAEIELDMDTDEEFEFEQALVYHVKHDDLPHSEFAKIHLKATHDALLQDPDFKTYIDEALKMEPCDIRNQAELNLKYPWER